VTFSSFLGFNSHKTAAAAAIRAVNNLLNASCEAAITQNAACTAISCNKGRKLGSGQRKFMGEMQNNHVHSVHHDLKTICTSLERPPLYCTG
jgi:hypothetical protein